MSNKPNLERVCKEFREAAEAMYKYLLFNLNLFLDSIQDIVEKCFSQIKQIVTNLCETLKNIAEKALQFSKKLRKKCKKLMGHALCLPFDTLKKLHEIGTRLKRNG